MAIVQGFRPAIKHHVIQKVGHTAKWDSQAINVGLGLLPATTS